MLIALIVQAALSLVRLTVITFGLVDVTGALRVSHDVPLSSLRF